MTKPMTKRGGMSDSRPMAHSSAPRVKVPGPRLNLETCVAFREDALARLGSGTAIRIDLGDVEFIDSSGIGALVHLRKAVGEDGRVILSGTGSFVRRVLALTGTERLFDME